MPLFKQFKTTQAWQTIFLCLLGLFFAGCCSLAVRESPAIATEETSPEYTLIFYIHGDNDYLFHFGDGTPARADEHARDKAIDVAENAERGEIFIFHQKEQRSFLGLFPRRNSEVIHYSGGIKQERIRYRHSENDLLLHPEADLLLSGRETDDVSGPTYFFYFGHEIPHQPEAGYHRSMPGVVVSTELFTDALHLFTEKTGDRFDLIALSTYSNGTPAMARSLRPLTDMMVASPQNLHLSYLDIGAVRLLEDDPSADPHQIASAIASESFERLSGEIRTVLTVGVYDLEQLSTRAEELYRAQSD